MSWWMPLPQAKLTQGFLFIFHCDTWGSTVTTKTYLVMWCLSACLWMSCRRCPQQRGAPGGPRPLTIPKPWRAPQMKLNLWAPAGWARWGAAFFIACWALGFSWDRASIRLLSLCYQHCDSRREGLHWGALSPQFLQAAVSAAVSWGHVRPSLCLLGSMKHREMWKLSVSLASNLGWGIFAVIFRILYRRIFNKWKL